jgi:glucosamine-phosphate N-acetyltransferase
MKLYSLYTIISRKMDIRELRAGDDHIRYCQLMKQLTTMNPDKISASDFSDRVKKIQSNNQHKIFVVTIDNVIVASLTLLIEDKIIHDLSSVGHIEDVVVDCEHRGKGIGKNLVEHAKKYAEEHGCYKVILDCNDDMVSYYGSMGFKVKCKQMAIYFE